MANWEIVDKFTILQIKLEKGLDCEEQYFEYLKETNKIDKKLIKELYDINREMWMYEELITFALGDKEFEKIGRLYYELRNLTHKRTEAKNKIADKYDKFKELKKY